MDVFNVFYRGTLKIGSEGQNSRKEHGISLNLNGRNVISPDRHIYFVDCHGKEMKDNYSTSIKNMREKDVAVELVKQLSQYAQSHPQNEKLSVGIICTYGDQARMINDELRRQKLFNPKGFKNDPDERFLVSTVDDFQGDERDVIIISMVRNPMNYQHSDPGFINAYQRINVALSRARRLLIILGSEDYLLKRGIINLPDIGGNPALTQNNFHVYEEILKIIDGEGRILLDSDIIGEEENRK